MKSTHIRLVCCRSDPLTVLLETKFSLFLDIFVEIVPLNNGERWNERNKFLKSTCSNASLYVLNFDMILLILYLYSLMIIHYEFTLQEYDI